MIVGRRRHSRDEPHPVKYRSYRRQGGRLAAEGRGVIGADANDPLGFGIDWTECGVVKFLAPR